MRIFLILIFNLVHDCFLSSFMIVHAIRKE